MASKARKRRSVLWLHRGSGQWAKKHRGVTYYFGSDREAAEERYRREWDDIRAGRRPTQRHGDELTLRELCNAFLTAKRQRVDANELTLNSLHAYIRDCGIVLDYLGKSRTVGTITPADFAGLRSHRAKTAGPVTLRKFIIAVRSMFTWAFNAELLEVPRRFGPDFIIPSDATLRKAKRLRGRRFLEAADVHKLLEAATPQLRAAMLLGLNGGFGSGDCSNLNRADLTARPGWYIGVREKTQVERRFPLWPETAVALEEVIRTRREPIDDADADAVFLCRTGRRMVHYHERADVGAQRTLIRRDNLGEAYGKLRRKCGIEHAGGFYALRHVHRTLTNRIPDRDAGRVVMGQAFAGVEAHYIEMIDDARLEAITNAVRSWLYGG